MRFLLLALALLAYGKTLADQPRLAFSFKSKNGFYELRPSDTLFSDKKVYIDSIYHSDTKSYSTSSYTLADRYKWGLYDTRTHEKLYTLENNSLLIEFKTALITDDGQNIVVVDDFSGAYGFPMFEMIHFFNTSTLVKSLTLGELLDNMCSVSYSVSHMKWCSGFYFDELSNFKIKTYGFYEHTYNLKGELISKISDSRINLNDSILVAIVKRISKGKYQITVRKSIRGVYQAGQKFIIECSDQTMRKIHGKFYGWFPARNREMRDGFGKTLQIRNQMPLVNDIPFPNYNGEDWCNHKWESDKSGE